MARPKPDPASPWRMVLDRILQPGSGPSHVVGIFFVFVGWVFFGQAVLMCWRAATADVAANATIEQRYYRMTPYHEGEEAARSYASGRVLFPFVVRSTAVLGFDAPGAGAQHVLFDNPRGETYLGGSLDWRIPVPWLELRFPPGTLDVLRSLPAVEEHDLARPDCRWCKTRYDQLVDEVDDPELVLLHAWTDAAGATVPLKYGASHPEYPFLDDGKGPPPYLAALPALCMGGFFLFMGLFTTLRRTGPDVTPGKPRSRREWAWVAFVLATPLWLGAFPTIAGLWSEDASRALSELARKPLTALQFFDVAAPEPVDEAPYEAVRALGPDSPYRAVWSEFRFERPPGCCDDGAKALEAAARQAAEQFAAFDPERRTRVLKMLDEIEGQQHNRLGNLMKLAREGAKDIDAPAR